MGKIPNKDNQQSREEERFNWITHALGVLAILVGFPFILNQAILQGDAGMIWCVVIFGVGMLATYVASTLYHYIRRVDIKKKLRVWDHIGIFFLIGGTYAPVVWAYTNGNTSTWFLAVMWSLILAGSILKIFFTGKYDKLSTLIYLALGWMAVFIYQPLSENMPWEVFVWILTGGIAYTIGVLFYRWHSLKYQHGIWHIFVMLGTGSHFIAIAEIL